MNDAEIIPLFPPPAPRKPAPAPSGDVKAPPPSTPPARDYTGWPPEQRLRNEIFDILGFRPGDMQGDMGVQMSKIAAAISRAFYPQDAKPRLLWRKVL